MISFKDVNKWFGDLHVLKDINLTVAKGEVVVVCGPSGSGKSTLIRCINRLEPIQGGELVVDDMNVHANMLIIQPTLHPLLHMWYGEREIVTVGWLSAQHRELDPELSTDSRPYHRHKRLLPLEPGEPTEIPWASALRRFSKQSPNMLLYWEAIKTACMDGYRVFDFGRSSPDSGPFRFKQQWGARPLELHWYYRIFDGCIPDVSPTNPKYTALVGCWKRLPLPVANMVGSWITRSLP